MPLPNGRYIIRSSDDGNRPIGVDEDRVIALPEDDSPPEWVLEAVGSKYRIKTTDDKKVVPSGGKVWVDSEEDAKWILEAAFHHGKNVYIVQAENRYEGWAAPFSENDDKQVMSRPLIVGPSLPPFYPPFERFIIERA
ncbi:hypothetical protein AAF712_002885 [Marasmius tenuissimus]|uniref:Uncharacterized protein n=1 Tax=Marasmius tenuissimus TaxID=585030 RepID=A0ABR3A8G8_9AGAR